MSTKTAHADFNTRNENNAHAPHVTAPHSHHASNSPPTPDPQSRSDQNNAAQPPFLGSASAEPPSDSELKSPSASELRNPSVSEPRNQSESESEGTSEGELSAQYTPGLCNEPQPDDRAIIAAHDPDRLLQALAILDFSPDALASELGVSPFALLDWLESEETQRQLTRYQTIERQMLDLRALRSRRLTIESLEHVLETTQDLVEERRTATTLLRLLGGTDLRDVRKRASNHHTAVRQTSAETRSNADSRNVSDKEPPATSANTANRASDKEATPSSPLSSPAPEPAHPSEPGSASDHGDDTCRHSRTSHAHFQNGSPPRAQSHDSHTTNTPGPTRSTSNPAAQRRLVAPANAEAPSESEQEAHSAEHDWDAFATWPKPPHAAEARRALRASTRAPEPIPRQRE